MGNGLDTRGLATTPTSGVWTAMWDGATGPGCSLSAGSLVAEHLGNATGNYRQYEIAVDTEIFNALILSVLVPPSGCGNVRVYRPGVDIANPPKFDANFLRMVAGARSLRFMDPFRTNSSNIVDYEDYATPGSFSYGVARSGFGGPVTSIAPLPNPDATYGGVAILATFAGPHGIKDGQYCTFTTGYGGGPFGDGSFATVGGGRVKVDSSPLLARVLSPTTIGFSAGSYSETLAATYTGAEIGPAPSCTGVLVPGIPVDDAVDLCNAVGADMWFNVPHLATDACVTSVMTQIARRLHPNLKCRLELSNEHWNYSPAFIQHFHFVIQGYLAGIEYSQYYALRASQVHALARAAFVAAGRPATDLIRVLGTQGSNPIEVTVPMCQYAQANGIQFDELAVAPYFENQPDGGSDEPSIYPIVDSLSYAQNMDMAQLTMLYGDLASQVRIQRPFLDQYGFTGVKVVCYEGGPESGNWNGDATPQAYGYSRSVSRSLAWALDPGMYDIMKFYLQALQDNGCTLFNDFTSSGSDGLSSGTNWVAFRRWDQELGRGDGSDGLYDNRTNYDDQLRIVAVVPKAIADWNALAPARRPRPPPRRHRPRPRPRRPSRRLRRGRSR